MLMLHRSRKVCGYTNIWNILTSKMLLLVRKINCLKGNFLLGISTYCDGNIFVALWSLRMKADQLVKIVSRDKIDCSSPLLEWKFRGQRSYRKRCLAHCTSTYIHRFFLNCKVKQKFMFLSDTFNPNPWMCFHFLTSNSFFLSFILTVLLAFENQVASLMPRTDETKFFLGNLFNFSFAKGFSFVIWCNLYNSTLHTYGSALEFYL